MTHPVPAVAAPPPPRRIVELDCAKAGPHWNRNLPTTKVTAVELLPYPLPPRGEAASAGLPAPPTRQRRLHPFPQADVQLLNGSHLSRAAATNLRYLLSLRLDDLLFAWRKQAAETRAEAALLKC